jgi:hypothetical protein
VKKKPIKTFKLSFNPLVFPNIDENFSKIINHNFSAEGLLTDLLKPNAELSLTEIKKRYKEITAAEKVKLLFAPVEARPLLEKLVWPLRYAKGCYLIGNCEATIALCGMVAEMVAILTFEICEPKLNDKPMTSTEQKKLFGKTFQQLSQYRRVNILESLKAIKSLKSQFEKIRKIRNNYLHPSFAEYKNIERDAKDAYGAAVHLVAKTIGQDIVQGRMIKLNPLFEKYLDRLGFIDYETT